MHKRISAPAAQALRSKYCNRVGRFEYGACALCLVPCAFEHYVETPSSLNTAITCFMSSHTSRLAAGLRKR